MNDFTASILSWILLPVALRQGLSVRRRTPRLPPPVGAQTGQIGVGAASWRILVMGDSSAAGVGAEKIGETLGPQIASSIHERTGQTVSWRSAGANSAIAEQVRDHVLPNIEGRDFSHVVLTVGTNDMKNFLTRSRFKKGFGGLLYAVHARWPEATVLWSPVIHMPSVPAIPRGLAYVLSLRTQIINNMGYNLCRERYAIAATPLTVEGAEGFAVDGFHANALGYAHWAAHLADVILDERSQPASSPQ